MAFLCTVPKFIFSTPDTCCYIVYYCCYNVIVIVVIYVAILYITTDTDNIVYNICANSFVIINISS